MAVRTPRSRTSLGPYTDTGLTNGTTYYYVISSTNTCDESANSAQVSATPASTVTVPAAPTGLAASPAPGAQKITLSWKGVTGATSYTRMRSTSGRRRFVRADRNHDEHRFHRHEPDQRQDVLLRRVGLELGGLERELESGERHRQVRSEQGAHRRHETSDCQVVFSNLP